MEFFPWGKKDFMLLLTLGLLGGLSYVLVRAQDQAPRGISPLR